ncbi:MAG: hypothetical protein JNM90_13345 [Burkholderiales bacterium]|nr:hypothetical protein [Burkholderiales bacterium]
MESVDEVHAFDLARGSLPAEAGGFESVTETYRRRFIDDYLRARQYELNDVNRATVSQGIELYAEEAAVLPGELAQFLDNLYHLDGTCWSDD